MKLRDLRPAWIRALGLALCLIAPLAARADVTLPAVIGDNMVLQRGMEVPIWGWAQPGEKVTVRLAGRSASTTADAKGNWKVAFSALKGGGILDLTVAGNNTIQIKNILLGEVWVCSGQSNMEMSVGSSRNAPQEIAAADFPDIRLLTVTKAVSPQPEKDCKTSGWQACSPKTVGGFSAVGYFFGRELHKRLNVPIGLIHTSWGGTPAESWTSRSSLAKVDGFQDKLAQLDQTLANLPEAQKKYAQTLAEWQKAMDDLAAKAQADSKTDQWPSPSFEAKDWKAMKLPQNWEQAGLQLDGIVWFRKEVDLPADWAGKDLTLGLGPIDDDDVTYFNGEKVGETHGWTTPRKYDVPGRLVKAGRNLIAVRVNDTGGGGGFHGRADEMTVGGAKPIALAGEWIYRVELAMIPKPPAPMGLGNPWMPTGLYNAMIHPLIPYGIAGAIWYQGESNAGRAYQYRSLFATMIRDWRQNWGQGDFPFLFVQLANFMAAKDSPGPSAWAELREAQLMTLALPKTGMAVIVDIGEANDIHPKNKQDVGLRLALDALANTYGQKIVYSGPLYRSMKVEGDKIRLRFDHVGGGLVAKGGPLKSFAIAGADKEFVWAKAEIDGETIVVSSDKVAKPVAVRYAWADNPDGCNLYNQAGLPASPFRTDDWPGLTAEAK